jgi:uncharacterized protein YndB with AHSA1/START domain
MTDLAITPVTVEVTVPADPARTFQLFTEHFDAWWPRGHHIGAADMRRAVIEPRAGGRWYEEDVDGSTCEWGRVLAWEPPGRLVLAWHLDAQWQYDPDPGHASDVEVTFDELPDGGTRVQLVHSGLERMVGGEGAAGALSSEGGWPGLVRRFAALVAFDAAPV